MITFFIAIVAGGASFALFNMVAGFGMGWSIFLGLLVFAVFQGVAGFFIQRRVKADMSKVQAILMDGQKRLQQKMQRWQMRPPGSIQAAQKEIFEDTKVFVRQALGEVAKLRKYRWLVPMMDRQIATAGVQLNWMVKDFREVDKMLPKALYIDPTMVAIRMARMYMLSSPLSEIRKLYRKGVARAKYNGNVLLAAAMSWMEVKRGDSDGAFKTLTEALKKSDNATLKQNHELLMNNRVGHFSNSGLGDQWYSLLLEEPKVKTQRQHGVYR